MDDHMPEKATGLCLSRNLVGRDSECANVELHNELQCDEFGDMASLAVSKVEPEERRMSAG